MKALSYLRPLAAVACLVIWAASAATAETAAMPAVKDLPVRAAMPDPLVDDDGQRITTPQQWKQRREQMKQVLEYYALGHRPPPPGNVAGRELQSKQLLDGKATYRLVHLTFGPKQSLGFDLAVFIPAEGERFKTRLSRRSCSLRFR